MAAYVFLGTYVTRKAGKLPWQSAEMTFTQNVLYPEMLICQCHQANLNFSKREYLTAKSVVSVGGSRD